MVTDQLGMLAGLVARLETRTLVVDIEPLLGMWGAPTGDIVARASAFSQTMAAEVPSLTCLVFATNARMPLPKTVEVDRLHLSFVSAAGKPLRVGYLANSPRPITVIGDQVVTDGLLAFRLGGSFVHWQPRDAMPLWPRMQTLAGRLIMNAFFLSLQPSGQGE
jgi:predicted HAD superfamily phosphohydrolase YqeG